MRQGRADKSNNAFVGIGLKSNAFGTKVTSGARPADGRKREPSANGINPGGTNMLGNMVGDHVTGERHGGTGFTGEKLYRGRGFEAPRNKSQSHGSGSQGRY